MNYMDRVFIKAFSDSGNEPTDDQSPLRHPWSVSSRERDMRLAHSTNSDQSDDLSSECLPNSIVSSHVPIPHTRFIELADPDVLKTLAVISAGTEHSTSFHQAATKRFDSAHHYPVTDKANGHKASPNLARPPYFNRSVTSTARPSLDVVLPNNSQTEPSAESQRFRPAWEVDHYRWPNICDRLNKIQAEPLAATVRSAIQTSRDGDRVIAVVGSEQGVGCTTVAMCLAKQLAQTQASVALLDANVDHPDLAKQLEVQVSVGWNNLPTCGQDLTEAAVASTLDNLTLVPLHDPVEYKSKTECRQIAVDILSELTQTYDLIVVDTGHTGRDVLGLFSAHTIEGINIIFVSRPNSAPVSDILKTNRLGLAKLPIVGIAENFAA